MRRWMGAAVLGVILPGASHALQGSIKPTPAHERGFQLTYTADVTDLPSDAREVRVWVPLARSRGNQRVVERHIAATGPFEIHVEPQSGNEMLYAQLAAPIPKRYSVEVAYRALVREDPQAFHDPSSDFPDRGNPAALERYLRPETLVIIDETVKRFSAEATAGRSTDLDRAHGIYDFVIQRMSYDKTAPGWGRGDTRRACLIWKGNCTDFHSLFISMARAAGLPARFVIGTSLPETEEGPIAGYHCWAEVYTRERGWIPVDASEAWKHAERRAYYFGTPDPNKLLISVGRDVELAPRQRGDPLNFFVYPYVEVDGRMAQSVRTQVYFRNEQQKKGGAT